mmetsp:Transcript_10409/g.21862  ORF Transcript_10409/g.21862 Transcript_10409/m.21862 type:complete len:85 (-) Transcript_10409:511-765(-)
MFAYVHEKMGEYGSNSILSASRTSTHSKLSATSPRHNKFRLCPWTTAFPTISLLYGQQRIMTFKFCKAPTPPIMVNPISKGCSN